MSIPISLIPTKTEWVYSSHPLMMICFNPCHHPHSSFSKNRKSGSFTTSTILKVQYLQNPVCSPSPLMKVCFSPLHHLHSSYQQYKVSFIVNIHLSIFNNFLYLPKNSLNSLSSDPHKNLLQPPTPSSLIIIDNLHHFQHQPSLHFQQFPVPTHNILLHPPHHLQFSLSLKRICFLSPHQPSRRLPPNSYTETIKWV